jgi:CHAD domain-containing protein
MNDKPALHPELAIGEALRQIAHGILLDARKAMESPDNSDAVAIHEFRREMKQWRALLRLLEPFLGEESDRLHTIARDLARDLGGARDPQSALDALDDLTEYGLPFSARSLKTIRKRIEDIRTAGEATALTVDMRMRVAAALDEAGAAVDRWPLHVLTFADIAKQLATHYRAARRAVPEDWSDADAATLHELRKLVVVHRYQMQIVEPLWHRFTRLWIAEAQRLRERLGQHQNLQVLLAFTAPHQPLAHWRARLAPAIESRRRRHVAAAKRIATRLFVDKPAAFRRRLNVMWETG